MPTPDEAREAMKDHKRIRLMRAYEKIRGDFKRAVEVGDKKLEIKLDADDATREAADHMRSIGWTVKREETLTTGEGVYVITLPPKRAHKA